MRKRSNSAPQPSSDDSSLIQDLIGLGDFSARKSYYPELLEKVDELEQEKERYKWLFENALHGIFQARIDGAITAANPAIARICGYGSAEHIQKSVTDISQQLFYQPEDYRRLLKLLRRDGQRVGFETQLRTANNKPICISMNVLLKDSEKGILEAFVQDITERKRAQRQLAQLNTELEQRVQERTQELIIAKQEAEEANASKDKYLAAASHDLLQPMNAARLLVSTLQERDLPEQNHQLVERIHVALLGAEELLTDLLDISRLDANVVTADPDDFNIAGLIENLTSEFQPVAANAGLTFESVACHQTIHSDSRLLMRILRNFISNAIRYTSKGRIALGCRRRKSELEILVCDTGPGIAEEQRQAIFEEFRQLDNAQPGRSKGVGLGLAIVDRIANMLGHKIEVRSNPGRGSCFSVRVPLGTSHFQQPVTDPYSQIAAANFNGARVLVLENEEAILHSMETLLNEWGCLVSTATNTEQALESCQRFSPDIVLADYHLDNNLTGTQVLQALTNKLNIKLKAIMITADRSDEVRQEFQAIGVKRLNKPIKPGKLRALMSHLIQAE
ncbi:NahK/ErcS family hybrid sensor histidine kinase/response regulator [Motiliproteus sp. MSK22-1]|uniref:PAS domain-containing hybrid sensor histidine kinase/response regulator n=1 Tax=Motiliproteus sp. MSK22-1 TaxID=1897630 RepID=UPI0009757096|nr:NahK/ErcS family hybrid sensor histidine kinase/response regulator [Motiliproteus sp. MSK22-1]OMH39622.1 hypothetical protein BGP75_01895 [Motiliproteus sp. MSK22-1]